MPMSARRLEELKALGQVVRQLQEQCDFDPERYGKGHGPFDFSNQATLLHTTLQCAVPLWAESLRLEEERQGSHFWEYAQARAKVCCDYLAAHADALMYRVRGQSAEAFNRLAEGLAIMALCPGGVKAFGSHWEYRWVAVD